MVALVWVCSRGRYPHSPWWLVLGCAVASASCSPASVATRRSVATASPTGRRPSYDAFDLALKPAARGSLWNAKLYPAGGRAAHAPPACVAADIALPLVKAPGVERSVRPHALQEPSSGYALF